MREVEALGDDSLHTSLDERDRVSLASKHWQIGSTSCQAVIDAALTGAQPDPAQVILVDLFMRQGEMAEAFCRLKPGRPNMQYLGFAESQDEINYVEVHLQDMLAEMYEAGVPTPTGAKIEQEMAADLMEPMPPHPRLNTLAARYLFFKRRLNHHAAESRLAGFYHCRGRSNEFHGSDVRVARSVSDI